MQAILLPLDRAIRVLGVIALAGAGAAMLTIMAIGSTDVVGTALFSHPVPAALELQEVLLAVAIFLALAHAQRERSHIAVDIVIGRLPRGVQRGLDLVALLATLGVFAVIAWRGWHLSMSSWNMDETANAIFTFPLWPGKFLVCFGAGIGALECLRQLGWWCAGGEIRTASENGATHG